MGEVKDEAGPGDVIVSPVGIASTPAVGTPASYNWRDFDPSQLEGSARGLAAELTTYRDRVDEILGHAGEYVVIKGDRIAGYYPDRDAALRAAVGEFGRGPSLIKRVVECQEPVRYENVL